MSEMQAASVFWRPQAPILRCTHALQKRPSVFELRKAITEIIIEKQKTTGMLCCYVSIAYSNTIVNREVLI